MDEVTVRAEGHGRFHDPRLRVLVDGEEELSVTLDRTTEEYRIHWHETGTITTSLAAVQHWFRPEEATSIEVGTGMDGSSTRFTEGVAAVIEGGPDALTERGHDPVDLTGLTVTSEDQRFSARAWDTHLEHQFIITGDLTRVLGEVIQRSRVTEALQQERDAIEEALEDLRD